MLVLNILPLLFVLLLQECLCTSELVTILSDHDGTSRIKECHSPGVGMLFLKGSKRKEGHRLAKQILYFSVLPKGCCERGRRGGGDADIPDGESHGAAPDFGHRIRI